MADAVTKNVFAKKRRWMFCRLIYILLLILVSLVNGCVAAAFANRYWLPAL
jgi:hypothetical protein